MDESIEMNFGEKFGEGLPYLTFLEKHGTPQHKERWNAIHQQVKLSDSQRELLSTFVREIKVFVLAGAWCGDCVNQCPIFDHFAQATSKIEIRYFDRDTHPDLGSLLETCGAARVPSVLFVSEDNLPCGRYGDRTLSQYRKMAATQLGPTCATGIPSQDRSHLDRVTQEWLDEFERIQWMLRLSGRLRTKHGD